MRQFRIAHLSAEWLWPAHLECAHAWLADDTNDLAAVTLGREAVAPAARIGKPAELVQVILDESTGHFLAAPAGPIIAQRKLGYRFTSAGVDRDGDTGVWLLPADPDASARQLRDALADALGVRLAVVVAVSDRRADRRGATSIAIGPAGIDPIRVC